MELANFRVEKNVNISRKNWVPEWCKSENFMRMYSVQPPIKKSKIIGNRHTNCVLRKRACYAPRPPLPSSWVHSPTGPDCGHSHGQNGGEEGGTEGSEKGGEEGSEEGGEEESEDSEQDVPLARRKRKVARV